MRVKKPKSKRTTTRMREGIKKKAAAQLRKNKKLSKKDPTWRSKNKDPGIPSSFPYKDKIISDLEESRRVEKEKKEILKRERQLEREAAISKDGVQDIMMEEDDDEEDNSAGDLNALMESAQKAAQDYNGEFSHDEEAIEDDDIEYEISESEDENSKTDVEKSRKTYDKIFKAVVEASDVILYVLDARDPVSTRSRKVEQAVLLKPGKRLILILNKVDLVPPNVLSQWLNYLKASFPTIPVRAAQGSVNSNSFNKGLTSSVTAKSLLQALKSYESKKNLKRSIIVGVIGYPNVGKSSIINALTNRHSHHSNACPVGNQAGVTTSLREVKIDGKLKILDSPGIVFPEELDGQKKSVSHQRAKLALLSALPPKEIKDPISAVSLLLKKFSKNEDMSNGLKKYYNLPPLLSMDLSEFTKQFLIHIARTKGRLGKGGVPNLDSAAMSVLNDWRDGRIVGWTLPKASKEAVSAEINHSKSSLRGDKEPPKVEQTTIVSSWADEFDLDGLLGDNFGLDTSK
ncbi:uncharacterized protein PRCAT00002372001 [Priceomyces carsonii]|uniref:uncharacterized protein n=1 Tax=Priceomyces carsonii TaxID=28549 RepID=UPI002ED7A46E|nr:unnamed protein product [Priceomyces carsonii]